MLSNKYQIIVRNIYKNTSQVFTSSFSSTLSEQGVPPPKPPLSTRDKPTTGLSVQG